MYSKTLKTFFLIPVLFIVVTSLAVQTPETAAPRQKFKSKMHIPVKLADESTPLPPAGYKLVWSEEFDGSRLNTAKWDYRIGIRRQSVQRPENVSVSDGKLHISLKKEEFEGQSYTGGGVISKQLFVYGYYEARFKTPAAEGWHTSFWTMLHRPSEETSVGTKTPYKLEIDFCEQDGGDPNLYSFGVIVHKSAAGKNQTRSAGRWVIEDVPNTSLDFHVWGCEFTPEKVRFYFDGKLAHEMDANTFPHGQMNVWLTSIAGVMKGDRFVDDSKLPNDAVFDYVRVYQNPKYNLAEDAVRKAAARHEQAPAAKTDSTPAHDDLN